MLLRSGTPSSSAVSLMQNCRPGTMAAFQMTQRHRRLRVLLKHLTLSWRTQAVAFPEVRTLSVHSSGYSFPYLSALQHTARSILPLLLRLLQISQSHRSPTLSTQVVLSRYRHLMGSASIRTTAEETLELYGVTGKYTAARHIETRASGGIVVSYQAALKQMLSRKRWWSVSGKWWVLCILIIALNISCIT